MHNTEPTDRRPAAWTVYSAALGILGLVAAVFAQTWGFDFLEWDDAGYVRDNPKVLAGLGWDGLRWALTSFEMTNWHPLTWWSYQLDVTLLGAAPGPMHLVNVLFHAANSVLVGALLMRFGLPWIPSLLAAAIFGVHPLHVESVAWIAERKDVLCAFFLLLTLLAWDRHVRHGLLRHYLLALLCAALGLLAKPMLVTLPCLLLILDAWPYARLRSANAPWFRDRQLIARCVEKIPFALLAGLCAGLTLMAQRSGGALRSMTSVGVADRLANAALSYGTYLLKSVLPTSLSFLYRFEAPDPLWTAVSLAVLAGVSWWAWHRRGPALAGWLWFLLTLLPVIGLVAIGDHSHADRYMYIPMIGLLMMLAGTLPAMRCLQVPNSRARRLAVAAGIGATLVLAAVAHRYTGQWRDSETLFQHALRLDPDNYVAHTLLTVSYEHRRMPQQAIEHADAALRIAPESAAAANAAVSASNAAMMLGDAERARNYLERAIAANPRFALPHYNLGLLSLRTGKPLQAKAHFERAIALRGDYSEAFNNLGVAFLQLGQLPEARTAFTESLRIDPANARARQNLTRTQTMQPPRTAP